MSGRTQIVKFSIATTTHSSQGGPSAQPGPLSFRAFIGGLEARQPRHGNKSPSDLSRFPSTCSYCPPQSRISTSAADIPQVASIQRFARHLPDSISFSDERRAGWETSNRYSASWALFRPDEALTDCHDGQLDGQPAPRLRETVDRTFRTSFVVGLGSTDEFLAMKGKRHMLA